jgi:hypothetical protein
MLAKLPVCPIDPMLLIETVVLKALDPYRQTDPHSTESGDPLLVHARCRRQRLALLSTLHNGAACTASNSAHIFGGILWFRNFTMAFVSDARMCLF